MSWKNIFGTLAMVVLAGSLEAQQISGVSLVRKSSTSITITWYSSTAESNNTVYYSSNTVTCGSPLSQTTSSACDYTHTFTVTGLSAGTAYCLYPTGKVCDGTGSVDTGASIIVTTNASDTPTVTPSATKTTTSTFTTSPTPTITNTFSNSPTPSVTKTSTPTWTPTVTKTFTSTSTITKTTTPTATPTATPTWTPTWTPTTTPTATSTWTPTATPTSTITQSFTFSPTWTPTATPTDTPTWTPTSTPTFTPTDTTTWTPTSTPTFTPTDTRTITLTSTPTPTFSYSPTTTPTATPTATPNPYYYQLQLNYDNVSFYYTGSGSYYITITAKPVQILNVYFEDLSSPAMPMAVTKIAMVTSGDYSYAVANSPAPIIIAPSSNHVQMTETNSGAFTSGHLYRMSLQYLINLGGN